MCIYIYRRSCLYIYIACSKRLMLMVPGFFKSESSRKCSSATCSSNCQVLKYLLYWYGTKVLALPKRELQKFYGTKVQVLTKARGALRYSSQLRGLVSGIEGHKVLKYKF